LKKLPKIILILFVAVNVVGGTVLGVRDYLEAKETEKMFADFYNGPQVKGAYDEKSNNVLLYISKAAIIIPIVLAGGIFYSAIRKKKAEEKAKKEDNIKTN